MDVTVTNGRAMALSDEVVVSVSAVLTAIRELKSEVVGQYDLLIITQVSSLKQLPIESSSMDIIIYVSKTPELACAKLLDEFFRVLKPNGIILSQTSQPVSAGIEKKISSLERKLLMAGFLGAQVLHFKTIVAAEDVPSLTTFMWTWVYHLLLGCCCLTEKFVTQVSLDLEVIMNLVLSN